MRTTTVTLAAAAIVLAGCSALPWVDTEPPVGNAADATGSTFTVNGDWWTLDVPDDADLTDGGDGFDAEANWGGDTGVLLLVETLTMPPGNVGLDRLAQARFSESINAVGYGGQEPPYEIDVVGADEAWRIDGYLDRGDAGTQHVAMVAARTGDRVVIVDGNWKDATTQAQVDQLEAALASLTVEPSPDA